LPGTSNPGEQVFEVKSWV